MVHGTSQLLHRMTVLQTDNIRHLLRILETHCLALAGLAMGKTWAAVPALVIHSASQPVTPMSDPAPSVEIQCKVCSIDDVKNLAHVEADDLKSTDQGIISAAIANATALLRKPLQKGQENIGVLEQQQQKSSPTNTQFTFTCETEAAKGVTFPEQSLYSAGYAQRASNMPNSNSSNGQVSTTHGAYTNSGMQSGRGRYPQSTASQGAQHPNAQGTKPRRRRGDVYTLAARQRRLQQEYANLHHPPGPEDVWICEFCEYESIFGVPPMALIRQYEIKDRKERKRLAEKRRLLEKAKMKGRKGKKQTKNAAKAANGVNQQPLNQQAYDQQPLDQVGRDGYLDDVYDDDSIPLPAPPPAPLKQPMPGAYDATMGRYAAAGNSGKGAGGG